MSRITLFIVCFLHCLFPCLNFELMLGPGGCAVGSLSGVGEVMREATRPGEREIWLFYWIHALLGFSISLTPKPRAYGQDETPFARSVALVQFLGGPHKDVYSQPRESAAS